MPDQGVARPSVAVVPTPTERHVLFDLDNVHLDYQGHKVLEGLCMRLYAGERVALVGKSGAGKSTLLRHLRQLQSQQVAWCPQQSGLVPVLSVYHNIYMGALQRHHSLYNLLNLVRPLSTPLAEVRDLAQQLGLEDQLFTSVDRLSGGQQQRTAIGRALYQQRPVLLADEPVSALDTYQGQQLLQLLGERHQTLVLALHDTDLALQICDRVIGLRAGRLALDAPVSELTPSELRFLYR